MILNKYAVLKTKYAVMPKEIVIPTLYFLRKKCLTMWVWVLEITVGMVLTVPSSHMDKLDLANLTLLLVSH